MARRPPAQVELNFDGLTDSVTNLVGALILLVLLIMGVTSPRGLDWRGSDRDNNGEQAVDELLLDLQLLQAQLRTEQQRIDEVERELPELQRRVQVLVSKALEGNKE